MNFYDKVHEMVRAFKDTPEFREYVELKNKLKEEKDAYDRLKDFKERQKNYQMEYIDGKTLKQLLKKRGSLTLSEAIDIMLQITDGMAHAHDSYIVPRDLKPQHIMIKDDGQIKITDFGIAMASL